MFSCAALALALAANISAPACATNDFPSNEISRVQADDSSVSPRIQIFPIYLGQGYCTGDGVRVRKGQGTSYAVVGTLYKGDLINVYNVEHEVDGWTYITHGSKSSSIKGYMSDKYISELDPASLDDEVVFEIG